MVRYRKFDARKAEQGISISKSNMKHRKALGLYALGFALIAAVATSCSGINATKSISPLDFILPGLMQNYPPSPVTPPATDGVPLLARASHVPRQDTTTPNFPRMNRILCLVLTQ